MEYEHLLSPIKIGSLTLRNRVVMGAMGNAVANEDQTLGEGARAYYAERAKGGVGLIINEATRVTDELHGVMQPRQSSVASDRLLPTLRKTAEAVHFYGGAIFFQLHHPGRQGFAPNPQKYTPSGIPSYLGPSNPEPCHTMSKEEIQKLVGQFVDGAERCYKAGIDGVELHGAHGYLIGQFFSPFTNRRLDEYGGSTENRARFAKEIIQGIRERLGKEYPIMLRISADEFLDRAMVPVPEAELGLKVEEAVKICRYLVPFGLDAIDVSAGVYESMNEAWEPISYPEGWKLYLAEEIKKAVDVPVFGVGVIRNPDFAEKVIAEGRVDGVTIARGLLADPEWVNKVKEGRIRDIRRCISCLNCMSTMGPNGDKGFGISCSVNPRNAKEWFYNDFKRNGNGRLCVVIGAGPAGLEAARILAERGFKVTLFESGERIGGQVNLALKAPHKEKMQWLIEYYETQLTQLGVEIRLKTKAGVEDIRALHPYAVFVATGSKPVILKGIEGISGQNVYTPEQILSGAADLHNKHVAVIGSGMTGLETAEFLVDQGNRVSIVEMADVIAPGASMQNVMDIRKHIDAQGTAYYPGHKLVKIVEEGVILEEKGAGIRKLEADAIVLSLGVKSENKLWAECKDVFEHVVLIGDAAQTGKIQTAVESGFAEAYRLN